MKTLLFAIPLCALLLSNLFGKETFHDEFEDGLSKWLLVGSQSIELIDSGDPNHKNVMLLRPDGEVYALIKDSDKWGGLRVEGEVLFPDDGDNYLGLIYNYTDNGARRDFGDIYIKGNDSYIAVNPWRDSNASRLLYEEYKTALVDHDAVPVGKWYRFKAEVLKNVCHFYANDMTKPKLVFDLFEASSGMIGFKPRIVGTPVWIDNITVTSISSFTYTGGQIPTIQYEPEELITDWEVVGPFSQHVEAIEKQRTAEKEIKADAAMYFWKPFRVDRRGAVVTGRITEYKGGKGVAYSRTQIHSDIEKDAILHFSSTDELALFINGRFESFVYRDGYVSRDNDWNAWFDFWKNPEHAGRKVPVRLARGKNQIVLRVRNGQFASGGFFLRLESP